MKLNKILFLLPIISVFGAVLIHQLQNWNHLKIKNSNQNNSKTIPLEKTNQIMPTHQHLQDAYAVSINRSYNGHFKTNAEVNNQNVSFIIDTGATTTALTLHDAKKIGININNLVYNIEVSTASGKAYAAPAIINTISIGYITEHNIRAIIFKNGLDISLLGMNFLSRMDKIETSKHVMIIRK